MNTHTVNTHVVKSVPIEERRRWQQPECYPVDYEAFRIFGPGGGFSVVGEGERTLHLGDYGTITDHNDFRTYIDFMGLTGTGSEVRDEDSWERNGWWAVYEVITPGTSGTHYEVVGEPCMTLDEAIADATERASTVPEPEPLQSYRVEVSCDFDDMESIEDAIRTMVAWLDDDAMKAHYRVDNKHTGESTWVDASEVNFTDY